MELTLKEAKEIMKKSGGNLILSNTNITNLPDNLTVGGWLDLSCTDIKRLPDNLTVGDYLDLSGTPIKSLPDNLTVGGCLSLCKTKIINLPNNLTVGGSLDLSYTGITNLPDSLAIGGMLYLGGTQITSTYNCKNLKNGDYVPEKYLYADNMLTHIKGEKNIKGYTFYIGKIKGKNVIFDGKNYAHCKTFKDGIFDLKFKEAKDRGAEQYKNLSFDSKVKTEELIMMYRIITGACQQGTANFVASLGNNLKESYTIREAIEITKGQYNADVFKRFFEE
ncbi:MAG: hypothetical protein ACI4HM_02920 [Ruminococcus sp.]